MTVVLSSAVAQAQGGARPGARPWERAGVIDVEALVAWAYGVQMVDRFERSGLHAIEAAAAGFEVRAMSADGVGQLMAIHHLGCRVDAGAARVSDAVHPVAWAVAQALSRIEGADVVRAHGRSGTRPEGWRPPVHLVRPAQWVRVGKEAAVDYQGPGRKGGYCQLIWVWDEGRQEWGRDLYRRWWHGLSDLAWALSKRALGFAVTGPAAPAVPWEGKAADEGEGQARGTPPNGSSQAPQP